MPGSGLVSMEQAALLMMQRVLAAESGGAPRIFALVLGLMRTRLADPKDANAVDAQQAGQVAVAASASLLPGRAIHLSSQAEVVEALDALPESRAREYVEVRRDGGR